MNLQKEYAEKLGKKLNTRVIGTGKQAFSIKMFRNGLILKRANRGELVLDRFDMYLLKDIIDDFIRKENILEGLKNG